LAGRGYVEPVVQVLEGRPAEPLLADDLREGREGEEVREEERGREGGRERERERACVIAACSHL
jgi:hypothetical protein